MYQDFDLKEEKKKVDSKLFTCFQQSSEIPATMDGDT